MRGVNHCAKAAVVAVGALTVFGSRGLAQGRGDAASASAAFADQPVPADLRPLLAPRHSELRLVVVRYTSDRRLLMGNYAGTGGNGGGRGGLPGGGGANGPGAGGPPDANGAPGAGGRNGGGGGAAGAGNGGGRAAAASTGGGRGGGGRGRGGLDSTTAPVFVSPQEIAHLKRFDVSWQSAVLQLDSTKLTPAARADRDTLLSTIASNLAGLDSAATAMAQVAPLLPFEAELVDLIEARILRHEDVNSENAAGRLTKVIAEVASIRAKVDTGIHASAGGLRPSKTQALAAAGAVDELRANLAQWFTFYNGYDPLFTWWMGVPNREIIASLQGYASYLRDTVAAANATSNLTIAGAPIPPGPVLKYSEVPDLAEIIGLPQDEMTPIVERFLARAGGGRGGGAGGRGGAVGGRGAGAPPTQDSMAVGGNATAGRAGAAGTGQGGGGGRGPGGGGAGAGHDSAYYLNWLAALKTIDFDHLSRNAQIDYLYVRTVAERQLTRVGNPLPANPPRKTDNSGIPGAARGREGLIRDLQDELIPYTPEQLIVLAEREFAWCTQQLIKTSREMGYGDNWKAALEKTKTMHVPPGGQPRMIRDLMEQAVTYIRAKDLVTVPEVDVESQPMVMMTPERQLASPFFLGGSMIQVSYPTDGMEYEAREESMRGNNEPWSHATAFHEMIPGHNMAQYYASRYADYRANLAASGPFWTEGWAVYWELTLYDMGFDTTPEQRMGALFWRTFRCARIVFSLKFHMGQWSPQEAVNFLVDSVGHEPANARAEVLRSFQGGYGPLYQAGYLLGALQLRSLRHDVVDSKQMTSRAFNDEVLRLGNMPIALVRLAFTKQPLTRDMPIEWKFYGDLSDH